MPVQRLAGSNLTSCRCPDELENKGFPCHPLGNDRPDSSEPEAVLNAQIDGFADQSSGSELLVQAFKPRRQIDRIAEGRVIHSLARPEIADDGLANMNAEPREEWLQTLGFKLRVERFARHSGRKSRAAGSLDMIRLRIGCVP